MKHPRALLFAIVTAVGCSTTAPIPEPNPSDDALARFNGGTITRADYSSWCAANGRPASAEPTEEQLTRIAVQMSLAAAAEARGPHPAVDSALSGQRNRQLTAALERHVKSQISVTDEQVEAVLAEHPDAFSRPRRVLLFNLYKAFPPNAGAESREALRLEMAGLREQLAAGADFAELARRVSESQTRFDGGRLGWVAEGTMAPVADRVAMALAEGEISQVVETRKGLTIFRCDGVVEASKPTPDEARGKIRNSLFRQARRAAWQEYQGQLLGEAGPGQPAASTRDQALQRLCAALANELGLELPGLEQSLRRARVDKLAEAELEQRVNEAFVTPTEDEVLAFFERRSDHFALPEQWRLGAIHLAARGNPEVAANLATLETLLDRIDRGEIDLAEAARSTSNHPSAENGGDLGWLGRSQLAAMGPRVAAAVEELAPGQRTAILRLDDGLWVLELRDYSPEMPMVFDEARDQARQKLESARRNRLRREIWGGVREGLALCVVPCGSPTR